MSISLILMKFFFSIFLFFNKLIFHLIAKLEILGFLKKNVSVYLLREFSNILGEMIKKINFKHSLLISSDNQLYIKFNDGIILNCKGTNRYLKLREKSGNETYEMKKCLELFKIKPKVIIDIGANFGENSIYFSLHYPESKILALEPSPENIKIFEDNLKLQYFDTNNIILIKKAVSDEKGLVNITSGLNSENSITYKETGGSLAFSKKQKNKGYVQVEAIKLEEIIFHYNLKEIDFVKIDIEGAEPLLTNSIEKLIPITKIFLIEFGHKNTRESYENLFKVMIQNQMKAYPRDKNFSSRNDEISFEKFQNLYKRGVIDIYFINSKLI